MIKWWKVMKTGQGYGTSIGGCIKDRSLLWILVKSQTYYPEHILAYESRNARYSLVVGFGSFRTDWLEAGKGGDLSTTLRPDLKCGGLDSKFGRGPRPLDRSEMGWSRLCLGYKRGVCFGVPSWNTLVRESSFLWDGTTWLWSSIVVRTRRWKVVKWFWLLNFRLKVEQVLT